MRNGVYNKAVFWPNELVVELDKAMGKSYTLTPTFRYAEKASQLNLPYGCYKVMLYGEVIEVEYIDGIKKVITRLPHRYDKTVDLCSAIALEGNEARVKTIWLNNREDNHSTINKSNYINSIKASVKTYDMTQPFEFEVNSEEEANKIIELLKRYEEHKEKFKVSSFNGWQVKLDY